MADQYKALNQNLTEFIQRQKIYFVSTAAADGRVNLSPKGMDSLRVINDNKIVWLNLTGSGNETAAHLQKVNRITLMFCSFDKQPMILRIYGTAQTIHTRDADWDKYSGLFEDYPAARQIFDIDIEIVQTSCGFAVPHYDFVAERETLRNWGAKRNKEDVKAYWEEKNQQSLDGFPTFILEES